MVFEPQQCDQLKFLKTYFTSLLTQHESPAYILTPCFYNTSHTWTPCLHYVPACNWHACLYYVINKYMAFIYNLGMYVYRSKNIPKISFIYHLFQNFHSTSNVIYKAILILTTS